jgi:hypothetical protein
MPNDAPNFVAGGTIAPCRFVSMSATGATPADHTVFQATAGAGTEGDLVDGISQEGTRRFDSADAAIAGDQLKVYGPGDVCLLELGSGGCTAGQLLKPDANGKGIAATTDQDRVGARALQSGAAGTKVRVQVQPQVFMLI